MDTVICGTSAFQYWRTPPIVLLLAAGPEDHPVLQKLIGPEELTAFRCALAEQSPFVSTCLKAISRRHSGTVVNNLRDAWPLLAPWADSSVEVLVRRANECHSSAMLEPHVWSAPLPYCSTQEIAEEISVTSPAFTMLQLAARHNLERCVLMASELTGSFAVYKAPVAVSRVLQKLLDRGKSLEFAGWKPSLSNGKLTNLWSRDPLIDTSDLLKIAEDSEGRNGRARLKEAAALTVPLAASPFEVQTGVLLGFSRRRGGEGFGGFRHNEKVDLTRDGQLLADRGYCLCDLYWNDGLDIECQSAQHHDNETSFLSDSDRTAALKLVGVDVLPVTFKQIYEPKRLEAFVEAIARTRGIRLRPKTQDQIAAAKRLREEVFVDWWRLPYCCPDSNS